MDMDPIESIRHKNPFMIPPFAILSKGQGFLSHCRLLFPLPLGENIVFYGEVACFPLSSDYSSRARLGMVGSGSGLAGASWPSPFAGSARRPLRYK